MQYTEQTYSSDIMVIIMFAENILVYLVAIISRKLLHTEELNW